MVRPSVVEREPVLIGERVRLTVALALVDRYLVDAASYFSQKLAIETRLARHPGAPCQASRRALHHPV